jgi:hypothetical protein
MILMFEPSMVNFQHFDAETALHICPEIEDFSVDDLDMMQTIVDRDSATLLICDEDGDTPLHCACLYATNLNLMGLLLKACPEAAVLQTTVRDLIGSGAEEPYLYDTLLSGLSSIQLVHQHSVLSTRPYRRPYINKRPYRRPYRQPGRRP